MTNWRKLSLKYENLMARDHTIKRIKLKLYKYHLFLLHAFIMKGYEDYPLTFFVISSNL